jgi:molecular chaperone GrpE
MSADQNTRKQPNGAAEAAANSTTNGPADGASEQTADDQAQQLAQAQAQAAEYLDNWRRATAELSNARKRMQREQTEFAATASARVLERLLPILDDFERAFKALPADQVDTDWVTGFRMIQRKLEGILESEGATPIPTEGQKFDPALHHAISHEEKEGYGEGDIIAEVGRGYKMGDRVLRPSYVRVAKE